IDPSEVYIIGGHYDSILNTGDPWDTAPGANDNASGVAAAIEVARVMVANNFQPASTIEFVAFAAEELGLYGSRSYASRSAGTNKNIALMLNNDMIAYEKRTDPNTWLVNILDYDNSVSERLNAQLMADNYTVLNTYNDNTYQKYSDSYAFFENGYPAIFFIIGSDDPNYHTIDDLAVNCNFEYCKEVTAVSLAILIDKTY
ncbi:MAG: M28 family metallopeptidase, partial [Bacteroidales bacterium]|nr:M28 family metallopeptidase [Bacteroidales bacterium]